MNKITVERKPINLHDWLKKDVLVEDFSRVVRGSTLLVEGEEIKMAYLELGDDVEPLRAALQKIEYQTSERTGGLKTTSRIFGYMPRRALRADFCSAASLARESPREHSIICDYARLAEEKYRHFFPALHSAHEATVGEKVKPEHRLVGTVFTSGIANKNNQLKYHQDSGNFPGGASCMFAFKNGVQGGYLCLPEYDLALEISDRSLTIFDGQKLLHGVSPAVYAPGGYRLTTVFYSLSQMWKCLDRDGELARIRALKTEREKHRPK